MGESSKTQTTTQNTSGGSNTTYAPWTQTLPQGLAGISFAQNVGNLTPAANPIAGFTPDQLQGMDYARTYANNQFGGGKPDYMTGTSYQEYMNPWLQDVGRTTVEGLRREHTNNMSRADARAANTTAFGGSGATLERAQLARGMNEATASTLASIMARGHDTATTNAMNARRVNASLDDALSGRQQSAIQGLLGVGGMQQALAQRSLDLPYDSLARIAQFLPGIYDQRSNYWSSAEGTSPDNSPGLFQQLLGGGLTLAGLGTSGGGTVGGDWLSKLLG